LPEPIRANNEELIELVEDTPKDSFTDRWTKFTLRFYDNVLGIEDPDAKRDIFDAMEGFVNVAKLFDEFKITSSF